MNASKTFQERAILVKLSMSRWNPWKNDKAVSQEVEQLYHAQKKGKYRKPLLPEDEIKKLNTPFNEAYAHHIVVTVPWEDHGWRMLLSKEVFNYSEKMRAFESSCLKAAQHVFDNYDKFKELMKMYQNGLYKELDYPSLHELMRKFDFHVEFSPVPCGDDFRLDIEKEEMVRLTKSVEDRVGRSVVAAMKDPWDRLHKVIKHISVTLKDTDKHFKDTLISNAVSLVEVLPILNIAGDEKLEEMRREVEDSICTLHPDSLRSSNQLKEKTVKKADDLLDKMKGYL